MALLNEQITIHFINSNHQNMCQEMATFQLAFSGSHPCVQIVTIKESKPLRENITFFLSVYHLNNANDDDGDDDDGPTFSINQTCPACGFDPEM